MKPLKLRKLTRDIQPLSLRAEVQPDTINVEARTVEVVFSTGARVMQYSWFEAPFQEELSLDPAHCRMERLNSGAPLLNIHRRYSFDDQFGVVDKAWLADGKGRAIIRFSKREDVEEIWQDVKERIIRNVSIGYRVHKYKDVTQETDQVKVLRAIDWEPFETSLVPIGADAGAGVRSEQELQSNPCIILLRAASAQTNQEETEMKVGNEKKPAEQQAATRSETTPSTQPVVSPEALEGARKEGTEAERKRSSEIFLAVRKAKLSEEFALELIEKGSTVDQARALIIDKLADADTAASTRSQVVVTQDETVIRREAAEEALLARAMPSKFQDTEKGRYFRGLTLLDLCREFLQLRGVNTRGMHKLELAKRGLMETGDLPAIFSNVANKVLLQGYNSTPQTFKAISREASASDFKQMTRVRMGDAPKLLKVTENGEIQMGYLNDGQEAYALATYARTVPITRQAIINDDLDAFSRLPMSFGRAGADLESDVAWAAIASNPVMGDSVALFHATHGNLGTAGAISETTLSEGRLKMSRQKGVEATKLIVVKPKFIIVPSALETSCEKFLARELMPTKAADVNVFAGKFEQITEPRLDDYSATAWYLAADPGQIDTMEHCYLEGQRGLYTETEMRPEKIDGIAVTARLDFAAKAIDHRGFFKNAGA